VLLASAIPRTPALSPPAFPRAGGTPFFAATFFVAPVIVAMASTLGVFTRGVARQRSGAATGDGFSDLVLPHLDAAYNLARYLARNADAAEDIVQDAVLKAYRGFSGYRGGDAKAWLLAIVRREFIDWSNAQRASRARFGAVAPGEEGPEAIPTEADDPERTLLRQGDVDAVRRGVEALPEPFRECIVLRELEELSYREIAAVTGVPIGTVMSRLSRGREMLAQRLKGGPGADGSKDAGSRDNGAQEAGR